MNKNENKYLNSIARNLTKPDSDLCLCMILDLPNESERIIIGSKADIKNKLCRCKHNGLIIFDQKRELGQLFLDLQSSEEDKWRAIIEEMKAKLWNFNSLGKETRDYLIAQNRSNNPVNIFLALCVRKDYYTSKTDIPLPNKGKVFYESLSDKISYISSFQAIVESLSIEIDEGKKTYTSNLPILPESILKNAPDSREGAFWHTPNRSVQCVFAQADISALLDHYIYNLQAYKYRFQMCTHCKKYFMTTSLSNKLCSEECKTLSKLSTIQKYKENHGGKPEEKEYSRLGMRLRRNINKDSNLSEEQKKFLDNFRKEVMSIAKNGKDKVFRKQESFTKYQAKTTEYENTFNSYHTHYSAYTKLLSDSKYNEANKNRVRNAFLPIKDHIVANLKEIGNNNMTIEDHNKELKKIFMDYEDLLNKLS